MSLLQLWHGRSSVQIRNINPEDQDIIRTCVVNNCVFLLTSRGNIYHGKLFDNESNLSLEVEKQELNIVDIGCTQNKLYWINKAGKTFASTPELFCNATDLTELESQEEIETITDNELIAKSFSVGARGIAYIDESGQLWASGWQRQLGIDDVHFDSKPSLISEFSERHIIDVCLGSDFGLVLLQPGENTEGGSTPDPTRKIIATQSGLQHNVMVATEYLKQQFSWVSDDVVGFVRNVGDLVPPLRQRCDSTESESFEELALEDSMSEKKNLSPLQEEKSDEIPELMQTSCSITLSTSYDFGKISSTTLSSHGSETELSQSLLRSRSSPMRSETNISDIPKTSSSHGTGSSSTLSSSLGSEGERAWAIARAGLAILETEVWSWGDAKCGQLGLGDMVKRDKPSVINRLRKCGVRKIACGAYHGMALLLDGRVFSWGDRKTSGGISTSPESSPKLVELPNKLRAHDIAAHNDVSYVLAGMGQIFMVTRHSCHPEGIVELHWPSGAHPGAYRIFGAAQLCCCVASESHVFTDVTLQRLTKEQQLLEDMIEVLMLP
jgi:hypothetical protein